MQQYSRFDQNLACSAVNGLIEDSLLSTSAEKQQHQSNMWNKNSISNKLTRSISLFTGL